MSICQSGVGCETQAGKILIDITEHHPPLLSESLTVGNFLQTYFPEKLPEIVASSSQLRA